MDTQIILVSRRKINKTLRLTVSWGIHYFLKARHRGRSGIGAWGNPKLAPEAIWELCCVDYNQYKLTCIDCSQRFVRAEPQVRSTAWILVAVLYAPALPVHHWLGRCSWPITEKWPLHYISLFSQVRFSTTNSIFCLNFSFASLASIERLKLKCKPDFTDTETQTTHCHKCCASSQCMQTHTMGWGSWLEWKDSRGEGGQRVWDTVYWTCPCLDSLFLLGSVSSQPGSRFKALRWPCIAGAAFLPLSQCHNAYVHAGRQTRQETRTYIRMSGLKCSISLTQVTHVDSFLRDVAAFTRGVEIHTYIIRWVLWCSNAIFQWSKTILTFNDFVQSKYKQYTTEREIATLQWIQPATRAG